MMTESKVAKILGKKRMEIVEEVFIQNYSSTDFLVDVVLKEGYFFDGHFTTGCIQSFEQGNETLANYWSDFISYFDHWKHDPVFYYEKQGQHGYW
tara:strand:- start:217 stop:501 length:285 start_codon:yes stop_codon:yes gene_type:complete